MELFPLSCPHAEFTLRGDTSGLSCNTLILHGAGKSNRARFLRLRTALADRGHCSAAFDFVGHGETGGTLSMSSLHDRTQQGLAFIREHMSAPLSLIGASMSGYTAIQLTRLFPVANLVLLVPAAYTPLACDVPFGPDFSRIIREPGSWRESDAFSALAKFRGRLTIFAAQRDDVIPAELTQMLLDAAMNAQSPKLYTVEGSTHGNLFHDDKTLGWAADIITSALT
ncbi:alpha/beta fold hydrolase [Myxococcota bacterium]|nr:alpha/beta fold hydrolase [Myxococcota bacterium]MBU1533779.1 alpha/beta fold hydrolase [Myxococcota bacterium]